MCSWQEREELVAVLLVRWQGIWEGSWIHFRCGLGFPDLPAALSRAIPGISWRRGVAPPQSPAQPSVCALFAASPDNCKPTAVSPDSPHMCFGRRSSNPGESCGNSTSRRLFQPRSLVSCFGLSVFLLIPFLQGGLEDAAAFTCGNWVVLRVNFEKLVCASGLKCKQGARCAPPVLKGVLLRCEPSSAHIGGLVGFIYGESINPFPLGWFSEPMGRCPRSCNHGHCKNMSIWPSKKRDCSLGASSLGNYGEFCGGPLKPCHDKQTKGQQFSGVDRWNCFRKEFGHPTSSVPSVLMCIYLPSLCQEWFGYVLPLF